MKIRKLQLIAALLLATLAVFLFIRGHHYLEKRQMLSVMTNGRNIFLSLYARQSAMSPWSSEFYPKYAGPFSFASSTEYLRAVVTSGCMNVSYAFFSAPGVPSAHGTDPKEFLSSNNAWCVVADISQETPDDCPFLFTKNLAITSLDQAPILKDTPPFGSEGVVVIMKNGRGLVLNADSAHSIFSGLHLTNRVLRP